MANQKMHTTDRTINRLSAGSGNQKNGREKMTDMYASANNVTKITYEATQAPRRLFIVGYRGTSLDKLANLLQDQDSQYTISFTEPGDACISRLALASPELLLIQNEALNTTDEDFLDAIFSACPDIRLIVFGEAMEDERLFGLVRAGAHGYFNGKLNSEQITRALECVLGGETWIERRIMERFIALQHNVDELMVCLSHQKIEQLCASLTKREIEILCEVVKGLAIKQIADEVHLSHQGVKMHLAKLFKKFNVTNRNQLILATFDTVSPVKEITTLLQNGLDKNLQRTGANA